jgi:hypothetical protein
MRTTLNSGPFQLTAFTAGRTAYIHLLRSSHRKVVLSLNSSRCDSNSSQRVRCHIKDEGEGQSYQPVALTGHHQRNGGCVPSIHLACSLSLLCRYPSHVVGGWYPPVINSMTSPGFSFNSFTEMYSRLHQRLFNHLTHMRLTPVSRHGHHSIPLRRPPARPAS